MPGKGKITIRKYKKNDYEAVCRIFYNGIVENWPRAYMRTLNFKAPISTFLQLTQLGIVINFCTSWVWSLVTEFIIQSLLMILFFYLFASYCWQHFTTDMRDKELSYWTCRGEETAGFFVAEVDGEIAGTVSYVIEEDGEMEMFRMSVDKKFRGRGVGGQLLLKIEETARRLKINKVRFNTSTAQEPAVALYTKKGYNLDLIENFLPIIDLVQLLHFSKRIES